MAQRTIKKEASQTRCTTCQIIFTTEAAQTRHATETSHRRYELIL